MNGTAAPLRRTPGILRLVACSLAACCLFTAISPGLLQAEEAEIVVLGPDNWKDTAPSGKEADAIYGDYVLRNQQIVCVVAKPLATRNANMTVRGVGGAIIDLTNRKFGNDQLSAFYPLGARFGFTAPDQVKVLADGEASGEGPTTGKIAAGKNVSLLIRSTTGPGGLKATVRYSLSENTPFVSVTTIVANTTERPITFPLSDAMRADRTFAFASDSKLSMFTAQDEWFRQCYAVVAPDYQVNHKGGRLVTINYAKGEEATVVPANSQITFTRRIMPAGNSIRARGVAQRMAGEKVSQKKLEIVDANGPVHAAKVTVKADGETVGYARTNRNGLLFFPLAAETFTAEVEAVGRPKKTVTIDQSTAKIELEPCGYLQGRVVDQNGDGLPAKIAIHAKPDGGGKTPYYGPDSAAGAIQNLRYTANGFFKVELAPGDYEIVVSRGPEYDAETSEVSITRNEISRLAVTLNRVVQTPGWISADFHSHSSPSGDNTGSQLGRVQNLIAEHVEFAPCTEHNRVSTYEGHLKRLKAEKWMATCSGMELTGSPLPINHQNAFPLVFKPHTQDGGGPVTDSNPVVQIERLAMWDDEAEKLVQGNHPNLVQMLGDRDLNGKFDGGFEGMFQYMDVIEVHPPKGIFTPPEPAPVNKLPRNPMFHWLQMLNLGYRITGVVNTDAHYNYHGSGWIRNYIQSSTDEPAKIDHMEMVRASQEGRVVMTTGPYLEVKAVSGDAQAVSGQDLKYNGPVDLMVKIQCPNWIDVNRVQVFVNGRPSKDHNYTRRSHPEMFGDGVLKFEQKLQLKLEQDAHVIVATIGEGLKLGRIAGPRWGEEPPVAVTNPIFVDVDGDGFKANGDLLDLPIPLK